MAETAVRKENHALRTITAVMMFFIAITHYYSQYTAWGINVSNAVMDTGRFVIPIFVMISGYFCFSKDGHAEANIKKKAIHILLLVLIFKAAYLVFSTILCISGIVSFDYVITELITLSPSFTFDCYGGTKSIMTTQPIWFIYALFLIYGLWYLFYRFKIDFKWTWVISLPILMVALIVVDIMPMFGVQQFLGLDILGNDSIGGLLYPFITIPFFGIGYYLHKHKEWIDENISNGMLWCLIFIGVASIGLEAYLRGTWYNPVIYVGSLIFSVSAFLGSFRVPEDRARCSVLEYIGKYMTMWMYVFFAMANFIISYIFQAFADDEVICEIVGPVVALLLDILMAFAFHQFLRYLGNRKRTAVAAAA